jgi:hypothetical protein
MRHVLFAEHDLHDPAAVPQVNEHDAAMVTAARNPARQPYLLALMGGPQAARLVAADHR